MSKNIVVSLLCVLVTVVVAVATLPAFGAINSGAVTVENEGAGALRFDLVDSHSGFNISYDFGDDHLTITNGSDVQTISYDSDDMTTIYYADDNVGIWLNGTDLVILGITSDNSTLCASITDNFTVQRTLSGVTITYGMESASFNAPTWAFIPNSAGKYGYFDAGTEVSLPEGARVAYVSDNFAGVYAYNGVNNFDLPITLEPEISDNVLSGAKWIRVIEELEEDPQLVPFDPGITPINPNIPIVIDDPDDPIVIDDPPNVIMSVPTPSFTEGDWGYNLDGTNANIVSYSGAGGSTVTVPSTIGGRTVTSLGNGLSNNTVFDPSLTIGNLVIPSSVTEIKSNAFRGCTGLQSVTLNEGLTRIGDYAFSECTGLTSITLPSTLNYIFNRAFLGCTGLTGTFTIPDNVRSIGSYCFSGCSGLTSVVLSAYNSFTISQNAFYNCTSLTSVTLHEGLAILPSSCFDNCTSLTTINFPTTLTEIGTYCFRNTGFNTITIPGTVKTIKNGAFYQCTGLTSLVLSEGIETIDNTAFYGCTGLTGNLIIPNTVTTIGRSNSNAGSGVFVNCTGISGTIILPSSIDIIGMGTFNYTGAYGLIWMIDSDASFIGSQLFYNANNLKSVLDLGTAEITATSYGLNADEVRDYVECIGYLAPVEYTTGSANDGPAYDLIELIPLVFAVGAVLFTVGYMLLRKF